MKREILFRGKRVDNGEWVEGYYYKFNAKSYICGQENTFGRSYRHEIIPETAGQFTGLTDRNGAKIFEWDVRDFDGGLGQVIWDDAAFAIKSPGSEAVDWEHSSVFINSTLLTTIHDNATP